MACAWWHTVLPCLLVSMTTGLFDAKVTCPLPCTCSPRRVQCQRNPKYRTGLVQDLAGDNTTQVLTSIPQQLPNTSTVTSLTITHMNIHHIIQSDFSQFLLLQELDLAKNKIDAIDDESFKHLSGLESLSISGNFLQELSEEMFVGLSRLKRLDVSSNRLVELNTRVFFPLETLEVLNLADNEIELIQSGALEGLYSLHTLILSGNRLMAVSGKSFTPLYSLETLLLDNCGIQVIEFHTFSSLRHLTHLSLANNTRLKFLLAEAFVSDSQAVLETLSLRRTGLQEVPVAALKTLSHLETLDLSETLIPVIRNSSFARLDRLVNLTLDALPRLYRVEEDAFIGLRSLRYLTITNNRLLNNISDANFRNLSHLTHLDLSNNSMETFPARLVDWQNLYMVDLRGNPLRCDCGASWMLTALSAPKISGSKNTENSRVEYMCNRISVTNSAEGINLTPETLRKQIACRSPSRFEGRCLLSLSAEDLCSSNTKSRLSMGIMVAAICCVSLLLCTLLYKFRRRLCSMCRGGYGYQMHRNRADSRQSSLVDVLEMEAT